MYMLFHYSLDKCHSTKKQSIKRSLMRVQSVFFIKIIISFLNNNVKYNLISNKKIVIKSNFNRLH